MRGKIRMVRDLGKESKRMRNGNRFVKDLDGSGVFARDTDRLLRDYLNLRKKIYNTYAPSFSDQATKEELRSYIDEQFVKLVKEYDINSPVDFPGYINKKLKLRVKQSFVKNKYKDKGREQLMRKDEGIETLLDAQSEFNPEDDSYEVISLLEYLGSGVTLTEAEEYIIRVWMSEAIPNNHLVARVSEMYDLTSTESKTVIRDLKEFVGTKLNSYNSVGK